jgi:hypothetical protein
MRKLSAKCLDVLICVIECLLQKPFWINFGWTMDELGSIYMIQKPKNNPRNRHSGSSHPKNFKTQKSSSKVVGICFLGQSWHFACSLPSWQSMANWSRSPDAKERFKMESCFLRMILFFTRRLLSTINWQIFTLKLSTQPTHLIGPFRLLPLF